MNLKLILICLDVCSGFLNWKLLFIRVNSRFIVAMGLEVGSFSRLTSRTSSFKNPTMERSLSFNSWEIPKETKTDSSFETKKSTPNALHGRNCESLQIKKPTVTPPEPFVFFSPRPVTELDAAATTLQKVYKSYRTRRNLADCAVLVEELWWVACSTSYSSF